MTSFRLANTVKTVEIAGQPCRVGKLTLGAALSIEEFLATLPTPYETLEGSKALGQVSKDLADTLIAKALADTMFWPPDAITALSTQKFLVRADFGQAFIRAMLAAYNPHIAPDEINRIAAAAVVPEDVVKLQLIAFGADNDPKDDPATAGAATVTSSASELTGAESLPG